MPNSDSDNPYQITIERHRALEQALTADEIQALRLPPLSPPVYTMSRAAANSELFKTAHAPEPAKPEPRTKIDWSKKLLQIPGHRFTLPTNLTAKQKIVAEYLIGAAYNVRGKEAFRSYLKSFFGVKSDWQQSITNAKDHLFRTKLSPCPFATRKKFHYQNLHKERYALDKGRALPLTPRSAGRCIGVEIECISPLRRTEILALYEARPKKILNLKLGEDGSVYPDAQTPGFGYEFRLLTYIDDLNNLKEFCGFLAEIKATVNKTCGFHVHLDARGGLRTAVRIVKNLKAALPFLCSMVPVKRRAATDFCKHDISKAHRRPTGEMVICAKTGRREPEYVKLRHRYSKINTEAFKKYRTIEVRMHSGTVQYNKIVNWINILYSIAHHKDKISLYKTRSAEESYGFALDWPVKLQNYCARRIKLFIDEKQGKKAYTRRTKEAHDLNLELTKANGIPGHREESVSEKYYTPLERFLAPGVPLSDLRYYEADECWRQVFQHRTIAGQKWHMQTSLLDVYRAAMTERQATDKAFVHELIWLNAERDYRRNMATWAIEPRPEIRCLNGRDELLMDECSLGTRSTFEFACNETIPNVFVYLDELTWAKCKAAGLTYKEYAHEQAYVNMGFESQFLICSGLRVRGARFHEQNQPLNLADRSKIMTLALEYAARVETIEHGELVQEAM